MRELLRAESPVRPVSLRVAPLVVSLGAMPLRAVSDDIPPVERAPVSDDIRLVSLIDPVSVPLFVAGALLSLRLPLHAARNMARAQAETCEVHFIAYTSVVSVIDAPPNRRERTA